MGQVNLNRLFYYRISQSLVFEGVPCEKGAWYATFSESIWPEKLNSIECITYLANQETPLGKWYHSDFILWVLGHWRLSIYNVSIYSTLNSSKKKQLRALLLVSGIEFARNASTDSSVKILPLEISYPLAALQSSDLAASRTQRKVCLFDLTFGKRCSDLWFVFFHLFFLFWFVCFWQWTWVWIVVLSYGRQYYNGGMILLIFILWYLGKSK